ncbi:MAG TPA: response regulator [Methylomirabilota bacterium]|nr:response regulator [Methylomirabilota bacterium]
MSRKILVVDDEHDLAVGWERLLVRRGWDVTTVGTLGAARAALDNGSAPALAIVDRLLPDGDGLDIVRAARARGTPVIIVTGHTTAASRRRTIEEGAAGFLAKPFGGRELIDMVQAVAGEPQAWPQRPPASPA